MEENDKELSADQQPKKDFYEQRRDFLKKSMYVAYATPLIMSMLVDKANAAQSWNPGKGKRPENNGSNPFGSAPPPQANKK